MSEWARDGHVYVRVVLGTEALMPEFRRGSRTKRALARERRTLLRRRGPTRQASGARSKYEPPPNRRVPPVLLPGQERQPVEALARRGGPLVCSEIQIHDPDGRGSGRRRQKTGGRDRVGPVSCPRQRERRHAVRHEARHAVGLDPLGRPRFELVPNRTHAGSQGWATARRHPTF